MKLTYRWKRNGAPISGATKSSHKVSASDAGKKLTVAVTGHRTGYSTVTKTSGTVVAKRVFSVATIPTISGGARVGQILNAEAGPWSPAPTALTYSWHSNGVAITGANASTLKLAIEQVGASITVTVSGSKSGYLSVSATSSATSGVLGASQLNSNDALSSGQYLQSPNTQYRLVMQPDGNLVEYDANGSVVWSSGTNGANHVVMQSDSNLVMYNSGGTAVWSSHTDVGGGGYAALQDDGNFVVYQGSTALWSWSVKGYAVVKPAGGTQGMTQPNLQSTQRATYPAGRSLGLVCFAYGQTVSGFFGSGNLWHQLLDGNYVPDVDLETGVNGPVAGEPQCGGGGSSPSTLDAFVAKYNGAIDVRNAAGTFPGQCVSLVSQYLLQVFGVTSGSWGNAVDYRAGGTGGNQMQSRGFSWHTDTGFQNGDILVWGQSSASQTGVNGHIGIWFNGKVFDQNDGRGTRTTSPTTGTLSVGFANFFSGGYLGYWRHG